MTGLITLLDSLREQPWPQYAMATDGTPTDCTHSLRWATVLRLSAKLWPYCAVLNARPGLRRSVSDMT